MSMKILDRYIAKTVLSSIGLVTLMLVGLQIFILFVGEIGDLGRADYGIVQANFFYFVTDALSSLFIFSHGQPSWLFDWAWDFGQS